MISEETVTCWRAGKGFETVDKPSWWQDEWDRIWPRGVETKSPGPDMTFGNPSSHGLRAFILTEERGWLVDFDNIDRYLSVWCPDNAAYLDLITSRAAAWLRIGEMTTVESSLEKIANTVIGYARHGQGTHNDRDGEQNWIDRKKFSSQGS